MALISQWLLNENAASITITDNIGGTGNDGVVKNEGVVKNTDAMSVTGPAGQINTALTFDGSSDYLEIPWSQTLEDPGTTQLNPAAFTWTIWGKSSKVGADYTIFGFLFDFGTFDTNRVNSAGYGIYVAADLDSVVGYYNTAHDLADLDILNTGWHFYALTYDGTILSLYVDNLLQAEVSLSPEGSMGNQPLRIGAKSKDVTAARFWSGKLADCRLYNTGLDAAAIEVIRQEMIEGAEPDQFTFVDITDATDNTQYQSDDGASDPITVTGIDGGVILSVLLSSTNGLAEYQINGGSWVTGEGSITLNDTIIVRNTSSASPGIPVDSTLTIGTVSDTWTLLNTTNAIIRQRGITWIFDNDLAADTSEYYQTGTFLNGDHWVVKVGGGNVTLVGIHPISTDLGGGDIRNGSMLNPVAADDQAYDSRSAGYNAGKNVVLDVSGGSPLVITSDSSLISCISLPEVGGPSNKVWIEQACVLTILSTAPAANSFRPPYSGDDKTIRAVESDIDRTVLSNLTKPANSLSIADLTEYIRMDNGPWIVHWDSFWSTYIHPINNMYWYGTGFANRTGQAALALNLDYTSEEKEPILLNFLQMGIDFHGVIEAGDIFNWKNNGAIFHGRKIPVVFAAIVLHNNTTLYNNIVASLQKTGDYINGGVDGNGYPNPTGPGNPPADYIHFQEDDNTHYITQYDFDLTHDLVGGIPWAPDPRIDQYPYRPSDDGEGVDIGLPEFGIRHSTEPDQNARNLDTNYRALNSSTYMSSALAIHIMGKKFLYNHLAFFDYVDRWIAWNNSLPPDPPQADEVDETQERYDAFQAGQDTWIWDSWYTYRADYPPVWPSQDSDEEVPQFPLTVTDVSSSLFLISPTTTSSGTLISNGSTSQVSNKVIQEVTQSGNEVTNQSVLTFLETTTITLSTIYPLREYSNRVTSVTNKVFVGKPVFTDESTNKAEIRYTVNGKKPSLSSKIYKKSLVFKQNTAGSDDVVLKYAVYYKGKKSEITTIIFRIVKSNSNDIYEFGPLQD